MTISNRWAIEKCATGFGVVLTRRGGSQFLLATVNPRQTDAGGRRVFRPVVNTISNGKRWLWSFTAPFFLIIASKEI